MSGFRFLPEAEGDLDELWEFIAEDNPDAADRVREEFYDILTNQLVPFPDSGHLRDDLTRLPLRFWAVRKRLITYAPGESPLLVVAILHGSRDPETLAAILAGRQPF